MSTASTLLVALLAGLSLGLYQPLGVARAKERISVSVTPKIRALQESDEKRGGDKDQADNSAPVKEQATGQSDDQANDQGPAEVEVGLREVSETMRKTIEVFFSDWNQALQAGEQAELERVLDTQGAFALSFALVPLDCLADPLQVMQYTQALLSDLIAAKYVLWDQIEILRALIHMESGQISVTTRCSRAVEGATETVFRRWILGQEGESWRVLDCVDLRTGVALSWRSARAFADNPGSPPWIGHLDEFLRGADALNQGDTEGVAWALGALEGVEFPDPLTGTVDLMRAEDSRSAGRSDAALRWLNEARLKLPDLPIIDRNEALIHASRSEWEAALAAVDAYTQELPDDADLCFVAGHASAALGRDEAAADFFRAGLAQAPESVDNMLGLARSLGNEGFQELRESFRRLENPNQWFEPLVVDLLGSGDLDAVEALIAELRRIAPDDPNGDYYEAALLMQRGQVREAANLLKEAFPKVADPEELRIYVQQYVDACVLLGVPKEAYDNSPDRALVFDLLCNYFLEIGNTTELEQLVTRHELESPEDPWLPYYRAELLRAAGGLDAASLRFEEGMLNAGDPEIREVYRWSLVRVLLEAGEGMRALAEVEPLEATFRQLVLYALDVADKSLLSQLIDARRQDRSDDPLLPLMDGVRAFWDGDYKEALATIRSQRDGLALDHDVAAHVERALILSALRTGALDLAEREARRSTQRDGDPFFEAIVFAAEGEHQRALDDLSVCMEEYGYTSDTFYLDPDLGPTLLGDEAYAFFRRHYPPPVVKGRELEDSGQ